MASAVSSVIGFAFSALCGALLFHVIDSPVYAVQVMIVCSIAIQLYRGRGPLALDRLAQPAGVPDRRPAGRAVGVWLLTHLPTGAYRGILGGLLIAYGSLASAATADATVAGRVRWRTSAWASSAV